MSDSQKNPKNEEGEDSIIKDMRFNTLLFEQKLQKLKKKAQDLQQKDKEKEKKIYKTKPLNRNLKNNLFPSDDKSKTKELNKNYSTTNIKDKNINNNTINNFYRTDSREIGSLINQDYSINNDTNTSMNNIYYTIDDDFYNDISIRKDYKIRELIKKNKQLKNEIEY